jgi:hypothetical protein
MQIQKYILDYNQKQINLSELQLNFKLNLKNITRERERVGEIIRSGQFYFIYLFLNFNFNLKIN